MDDREPDVDPYFSDALKSSDSQRKELAIREYLDLYLKSAPLSRLVMVREEFFFKDEMTKDHRYIPKYEDINKITAPKSGTIILNIDSTRHGTLREKGILHEILLFCLVIEYLLEHPDEKRLKKSSSGWSHEGMYNFLKCLRQEIFGRNYGSPNLLILYVAPDLSAIYSNHGFQNVKILERIGDRIVVHYDLFDHHVSFVLEHSYKD
jgi:hypothetical protein